MRGDFLELRFNKVKKILVILLVLFMISTYTSPIFAGYADSIKVGDTLKFTGSAWTVYKTEAGAKNLNSSDIKRYLNKNNTVTVKYKNGNVLKIGNGEYIYYGSTASKYFSKVSSSSNSSTQTSNNQTTSQNSNKTTNISTKRSSLVSLLLNRLTSRSSTNTTKSSNTEIIPNYEGPGYKFYYNNLDDKCKKVYRYMYSKKNDLIEGKTIDLKKLNNTLGGLAANKFYEAMHALELDQPEFYYITSTNKYTIYMNSVNKNVTKLSFTKVDSSLKNNLAKIDSTVNSLVSKVNGKSNYEKLKYLHDWICNNMSYQLNSALSINGFIVKKGQCMTYAMMYKYLLNKLNIDCIYVSGTVSSGGAHAWNYVRLNNKWYGIDVCWDDPSNRNTIVYTYFLKGKNTFKDRTLNYSYPTLNSQNY